MLSLPFQTAFLKTFRLSGMTTQSPELGGGGREGHLVSLGEGSGSIRDRAADSVSGSGWEFRGRNLNINHSVPELQIPFFLLKNFKQLFLSHRTSGWLISETIQTGNRICPDKN